MSHSGAARKHRAGAINAMLVCLKSAELLYEPSVLTPARSNNQVRAKLLEWSGAMHTLALNWLAEKDQEAARLEEVSRAEQMEIARSAIDAALEANKLALEANALASEANLIARDAAASARAASDAAVLNAKAARTNNKIAIAALIVAAIAIVISIVGMFRSH